MSASIDKESGESDEDSREILSSWLDDYIAGRCERTQMHESFLQVCRSNPEAPWDALALLDQYQRRGRVDVALARSLKAEIAQLVFGAAHQTQTEEPRDSEAMLDTTGSRWRKLYAERGSQSVNADRAAEDPALRRDFDPLTRPPPEARTRVGTGSESSIDGPTQEASVAVGTVLRDRYELLELLGSGGDGTVYRAYDRHRSHLPPPACYVAVRVLQLGLEERERALAELEREAYDAQSLSHPNIVSVFDLDRHLDTYFVVMELLQGESLHAVMQRQGGRPLSRDRALVIIGAVGAALMHAHGRNIAHGDLKPASVILTTDGDIKVLDFGFARSHRLDQWTEGEPSLDGIGASSTAAYASAERIAGDAPQPRDDVYSLACIAYELLTGRHPFGGRSGSLARTHGRPVPRAGGLNGRQWQVLANALQWSRADRRTGVADLLSALGCPIALQACAPTPESRRDLENPFGRGKGMLLAFIFVVFAGGLAWWQSPRFIEPLSVSPGLSHAAADPEPEGPPAASVPAESVAAPDVQSPQVTLDPSEEEASAPPAGSVVATADLPASTEESSSAAAGQSSAEPRDPAQLQPPAQANPPAASGPVSIEFDKDTYVVSESDGTVRLTVRRSGSTRAPVRFRWSLRPNSAEAGSDYAAIGPDIEEIPAGSRTATLTIPIVSDAVPENTELFLVELETLDGSYRLGERAHAAVIIVDDD